MSIYRRALRYYRPFWGQTFIGLLLALIGIALNLLKRAKPTISLKNRRKRAGWNTDYLAAVIQQAA